MPRHALRSPLLVIAVITCLGGCADVIGLDEFADATRPSVSAGTGGATTSTSSSGAGGDNTGVGGHGGMTGVGGSGGAGGGVTSSGGAGGGVTSSGSGGAGGGVTSSGGAGGGVTSSGGAGGSGGSVSPTCAGTCVGAPPTGWTGPVAYASWLKADATASCPTNYPNLVNDTTYLGGLDAGDLSRDCACGSAEGVVCEGGSVTLEERKAATCEAQTNPNKQVLLVNTAKAPTVSGTVKVTSYPKPSSSGTCPAIAQTTPAYASNTTKERACKPTTPLTGIGCGGASLCAPPSEGEFTQLCLYRAGEQSCPTDYPEQHVAYESIKDSRVAGACECLGANSHCGTVEFSHFKASGGIRSVDLILEVASCGEVPKESTFVEYVEKPFGSCMPKQAAATGELQLDGKVTFCCQAPPAP